MALYQTIGANHLIVPLRRELGRYGVVRAKLLLPLRQRRVHHVGGHGPGPQVQHLLRRARRAAARPPEPTRAQRLFPLSLRIDDRSRRLFVRGPRLYDTGLGLGLGWEEGGVRFLGFTAFFFLFLPFVVLLWGKRRTCIMAMDGWGADIRGAEST